MLQKIYIQEEGQMDSANLTFSGLKVTERQFTCSVKGGGIVFKCFASGSLLSAQLKIVYIVASEIYNLYF